MKVTDQNCHNQSDSKQPSIPTHRPQNSLGAKLNYITNIPPSTTKKPIINVLSIMLSLELGLVLLVAVELVVVLAVLVVVLGNIDVALDEIVILIDGVGKLSDALVVAMPQNCCARFSAVASSVGHVDDIHITIEGANLELYTDMSVSQSDGGHVFPRTRLAQKQLTSTSLVQFALETATPRQVTTVQTGDRSAIRTTRCNISTHHKSSIHSMSGIQQSWSYSRSSNWHWLLQ